MMNFLKRPYALQNQKKEVCSAIDNPLTNTLDVINKSHWDHKVGDPPFKARKKCWHQMIVATHDVMERNFRCSFEWPITNLMIGPVSA